MAELVQPVNKEQVTSLSTLDVWTDKLNFARSPLIKVKQTFLKERSTNGSNQMLAPQKSYIVVQL